MPVLFIMLVDAIDRDKSKEDNYMLETGHPFVDNGNGFPTPESVSTALNICRLGALADRSVTFRGEEGTMVDLIVKCRIEHLTENWPRSFIGRIVGIAAQAGQQRVGGA